jgi:hypothetical protein
MPRAGVSYDLAAFREQVRPANYAGGRLVMLESCAPDAPIMAWFQTETSCLKLRYDGKWGGGIRVLLARERYG